eukprot:Skav229700  [mRNA]  locus=scaffold3722:270437:278687:- [translate_table: standard]
MDLLAGGSGSGNVSVQIDFFQRLANDTFKIHELAKVPENSSNFPGLLKGLEVADWDQDGKLDLLLCFQNGQNSTHVHLLNGLTFPVTSMENSSEILSVRGDVDCDMQLVDFDEDGDDDLFFGQKRYFERRSTELVERRNPLGIFNGKVIQIVDFDGDGRLEVLIDSALQDSSFPYLQVRCWRRALDGSFAPSFEDPFSEVKHTDRFRRSSMIYFADWNSDGLPDILLAYLGHSGGSPLDWPHWDVHTCYLQVKNQDMAYNSHLTMYEDVKFGDKEEIMAIDWNQDGLEDHVLVASCDVYDAYDSSLHNSRFFEIGDQKLQEVSKGFAHHCRASLVDWNGDGELDLISACQTYRDLWQVHYQEGVSGGLKPEEPHHQFSNISFKPSTSLGVIRKVGVLAQRVAALLEAKNRMGDVVSNPGSETCRSCEGHFFRSTPDAAKQSCHIDSMEVLLAVALVFVSICFSFLCLSGFVGQLAIADVSAQGEKLVITTAVYHLLMKRSCVEVTFRGTGVPDLENMSWKVQALNSLQLTLHGESSMQLDTSMGHLTIRCPGAFLHTGLWHGPLIVWCLFFGAAAAGIMSRLTLSLNLLVASLGIFAGALAFAWRLRQGSRSLLLCTATGVLQQGRAGTDVAVRVAQRAAELDTRKAEATAEADRLMIHAARLGNSFGRKKTWV